MPRAFAGEKSISQYYRETFEVIRLELLRMSDEKVLANDEQTLVSHFGARILQPIEKDPERKLTAHEQIGIGEHKDPSFDRAYQGEIRHTIIEYPLLPRATNATVVQLTASMWPMAEIEASFRAQDHMVVVKAFSGGDVADKIKLLERMMEYLNDDIGRYAGAFPAQIAQLVQQRKAQVARATSQFEQQMAALGIEVQRKVGAVEPVNVEVKREITVLREARPAPGGPAEPHLTPESVQAIVKLIDQAGKNFEVAPASYVKLGEEDLRNILVGDLNAVFGSNVASGETFSKGGKSDILLNAPGGAVLVAECKFWGGEKKYGGTLEQLFGYLTWRHTVGLLITFSRAKGLTKVVQDAGEAAKGHPSYREGYAVRTSTYFVSNHEHPADSAKRVLPAAWLLS